MDAVPAPPSKEALKAVRDLARCLRERDGAAYAALADRAQSELQLDAGCVAGDALGAIDTFRFEEAAAAQAALRLVAAGRFEDASRLVAGRGESFWAARDAEREAAWQACRLMIEVGERAGRVRAEAAKAGGDAGTWVGRYASGEDAWFRLDLAQRRLETLLPLLDAEVDERAVAAVRRAYEDALDAMASGFIKTLEASGWTAPGVLAQPCVWAETVEGRQHPVAVFFVDALRFEMGAELADHLTAAGEVQLRPALGALPSITPVGMAAVLPGAAAGFSIVEQGGRLGARIATDFLPDRAARRKWLEAQVPGVVQLELDDVITLGARALKQKLGQARVVAVHSTDIDGAGETPMTTASARRVMSAAVGDVARAVRKLAAAGIGDAVVSADHGHLFFAEPRPEAMRMDPPGGQTVDLHRRCWVGRGGATPPGAVRVAGRKLGYDTDLDFVFPAGAAVFRSGGDLAYHHGGASLQELVVPVLTVKTRAAPGGKAPANSTVTVSADAAITNRIFIVRLELATDLLAQPLTVRPVVVAGEREVAQAAMAQGAELAGGRLTLQVGTPATVGFTLTDDTVAAVRIQVLHAGTDAPLYASPEIPVRLGV